MQIFSQHDLKGTKEKKHQITFLIILKQIMSLEAFFPSLDLNKVQQKKKICVADLDTFR